MPELPESTASFIVTPDKKATGESMAKTNRAALAEIKNLTQGSRKGYIGEPPPSVISDAPVAMEKLTIEERKAKSELQRFLAETVSPPMMSIRTPPEKAKVLLVKKLSKMTLGELRRFWSKAVPESVSDEDKALIQGRWDDISP